MGTILALLFLLFTIAAIPLFLTLIYKHFYDNHVNRCLLEANPGKKWLSPLTMFVLLILVEFILYVGAGMLLKYNTSVSDDSWDYQPTSLDIQIQSQAEIDETILKVMNGSPVDGYQMTDRSQGDISCQVYYNTGNSIAPGYVIRLVYTGAEDIGCWDVGITYGQSNKQNTYSQHSMSDFEDSSSKAIYILISNQLAETFSDISFSSELYKGKQDDYSTGDLGTFDMPEAAAALGFELQ